MEQKYLDEAEKLKNEIKNIIYKNSHKGGMAEDLTEGQIIGLKTGVELDECARELGLLFIEKHLEKMTPMVEMLKKLQELTMPPL